MARTFVLEDTKSHDYRYICSGLRRRGWEQINLPRRAQQTSKLDRHHYSSWVCHGGPIGVSCVGRKEVTRPDLIWTLSRGRSPGLNYLGPDQATNFYGASSACLTTKAGLCRTLQGTKWQDSRIREEGVAPESFFPRCFDLSDSSQLEDFKENFRQTAAEVVLKVFCRLLAESPSRPSSTSKPAQLNVSKAGSTRDSRSQRSGSVEGPGVMGGLGYVHPCMLALAVRACRRHLLEMSGWQEDQTGHKEGAPSDANGAESLTDREWEALLMYSYSLRKVAAGATNLARERLSDGERESEEAEEHVWSCPAGVGLRGARGLRCKRAGVVREEHRKRARRPSSAPVERRCNNVTSQRPQRLSHRARTDHDTAPPNREAAAPRGAWTGLGTGPSNRTRLKLRGRGPSAVGQSAGCACACGVGGEQEGESECTSRLAVEAKQLCATFERRCPQWTIDGERNLWVLKPAGASKGQGVRVAWTLGQILCAQKTMGGRVAQKYVEVPLLLPRWPRIPRLPEHLACPGRGNNRRRREIIHGGEAMAPERSPRTRRRGKEEQDGARRPGTCEPVQTCRNESNVVEKGPTVSNGETGPPSARSEDHAHRYYAGDKGHVDVDPGAPTGERKFDIRTWVLVTSWDPLEAFVFDEGYLRVCPQNFTLDESKFAEPQVHLTNLSARRAKKRTNEAWDCRLQQRRARGGRRRRRPSSVAAAPGAASGDVDVVLEPASTTDATTSEAETEDFVASQAELFRRLGEMEEAGGSGGGNGRGEDEEEVRARGERLWRTRVSPSIEGVVRRTLLAAKPHARQRAASFQLFGFDLLLDRQLRPWLLEVNLSPALSHSSKRQSALISSMCEGLLRLTVDRIFSAPPPPVSNADHDGTRFDSSDTRTSTDAPPGDGARHGKVQGKQARHHSGKWRPITQKADLSTPHKQHPPELFSTRDAGGGLRNPSDQVFSLTGRRLTKRTLARAERGVREATAAKVLAVWWRSLADECREARSRKLRAIAEISAWVTKTVARRRRKALARSRSERSARVIQARWRRAAKFRRLAARTAACVVVQTVWRQRRRKRRRASRRARQRASSGLKRWARLILSRRQDMARETILRAVSAATTRHASKRRAAAVIVRALETTCDRRRQSRLRLQRFARTSCLLRARLAALSLARVHRVRNGAATILARAFRQALARSATVRAVFAACILQSWHRRLLRRRETRHASVVTIRQAWEQRGTRRLSAEAQQPPRKGAARTTATESPTTATNAPACHAVIPGKLAVVVPDGAAALEPPGSTNVGQLSPRRKEANSVPLAGHSYASRSSPSPERPAEEKNTRVLRVPIDKDGDNWMSSAVCDELLVVSPATTARENWSDPDLCLADGGGVRSCRSHVSGDGDSSSYNETCCATAVTTAAPRSPPLSGRTSTRRAAADRTQRRKEKPPDGSPAGGILDLEDILPDILRRRQRENPLAESGQHGWSDEGSRHLTTEVKGTRYRPTADGFRGMLDHGRVTPALYTSRGERLPYPPAGGTYPIDTRAQQLVSPRGSARARRGKGRAGVATEQRAPELSNRRSHRGEAGGSFPRGSRPRNSGCRGGAPKGDDHNSGLGRNGTPAWEFPAGPTGASKSSRLRVGPASRRVSAKRSAKRGAGMRGATRDSLGSSGVRWKGGSGGVLGMLAFMEA